jgi:hypothetical protein
LHGSASIQIYMTVYHRGKQLAVTHFVIYARETPKNSPLRRLVLTLVAERRRSTDLVFSTVPEWRTIVAALKEKPWPLLEDAAEEALQ